ncbi:YbhB/YbcL family Raf kinase inhibitor-like protein [Alloscardovia criceti]|uniref:YbhB/YbcL family Raf kinase inhibitor-like protein n=1 Tax=Alloscardovia criceti TaxID=356828 RepID=UPI000381A650|nr:YbhB/YbcL family Raf kinase inhibitor-like protein [Alloscardovia criceti]
MKISADFTQIPDKYGKFAPQEHVTDGYPTTSFPFYIDRMNPAVRYLHWEFFDDDAIPVCGFQWIHWTVANVPVDALMYDFNDAHALQVPEDFSRNLPTLIPEAVQGRNSAGGALARQTNPAVITRYNGPQPPDKEHAYKLCVYGTDEPILELHEGFYLNELRSVVFRTQMVIDYGEIYLNSRAS